MILGKSTRNNAVGPLARDASAKAKSRGRSMVTRAVYVALSSVAGLSAATQVLADQFDYHASLGFQLGHVYPPWKIVEWGIRLYPVYPETVLMAGSVGMLTAGALIGLMAVAVVYGSRRAAPNEYAHGSARWADPADVERAGLLSSGGDAVYVGAYRDPKTGELQYLRHSGPEHVLAMAPTRSGKGVGLVVPTLLSWTASAFVADLKGELWALTAGWRKKHAGNRVIRFEPALAEGGAGWNPLDEIRSEVDGANVQFNIGDIQNIASLLVDPDGKGLETHWQKTSFSLLTGVILHAKYLEHHTGQPATLPGVRRLLSDPKRPTLDLWKEMLEYPHVNGAPNDTVAQTARDMLDSLENGPEEASSIVSTAKSYLGLYLDPVVAANVSRSDFRIRDLMNHDDPVTLYMITQPNDKARLRPLVRILISMIVRLLADKMDFEDGRPVAHYKHRLLMMLDEFPTIGKLNIIQESLAFLSGYGIKMYLIIQGLGQLRSRDAYGPDEEITGNCHVQNAFPPNKLDTAKHLSEMTGTTTFIKKKISVSGKRGSPLAQNFTETYDEISRPLLTPDEILRLPGPKKDMGSGFIVEPGDMLVFVAGFPAVYGIQPLYFQDPSFAARAAIKAPDKTDTTVSAAQVPIARIKIGPVVETPTPQAERPTQAPEAVDPVEVAADGQSAPVVPSVVP